MTMTSKGRKRFIKDPLGKRSLGIRTQGSYGLAGGLLDSLVLIGTQHNFSILMTKSNNI